MPNVRLAFRTLRKSPFVTLVAILSLSLGIGANSAIFSLFDQMLLRALPVPSPEELVNLAAPGPKPGSDSCNSAGGCDEVFSYPMFRDLEAAQEPFAGLAAHRSFGANLAYKGQTLSASGMMVSGSYFPTLGVQPALGRLLGPDDDRTPGGHFVAVLSHAYWQSRFGQSPDVLNETLTVNGAPYTIVGVAPRGFEGTTLGIEPSLFVPITMREQLYPTWEGFDNRRAYWVYVFGRLRPGVSIEQAREAINVLYHGIINDVEAPLQTGMSDPTLVRFRAKEVLVAPGRRGQSVLHREALAPLLLLLCVTGIVLLIACANIANLLLARAANRRTELAVRLSIGANRRHVIGQLLTESVLLGILGGLGGLVTARWTLSLILSQLPPQAMGSVATGIDARVLLFAAALSIGTGVLFGLFPALYATRSSLITGLRAQAGMTSGVRSTGRFRTLLATSQIVLSMALLISAGLFVKSLMRVSRVDLGLDAESMATFAISPQLNGYEPARSRALFQRLESELEGVPGVAGVAASMVPVLAGSSWGNNVSVEGFEAGPDTDTNSRFNEVGPGFFRTIGIPLLSGREFTESDVVGSPKVAIVNEAFARKFNLGREAVGKWMAMGNMKEELDIQIVGLIQDAKYSDVKDEIPPQFFRPYLQDEDLGFMNFYVRSFLLPEDVLSTIQTSVSALDPNLPVEGLKTMEQQIHENVFVDRMVGTLSAAFAILATLLAAVGLYGVLAYTIAQRTREIGLRIALGADRGSVRAMVFSQVGRMTVVGGVIGVGVALGLGRLARSLLFEIEPHDPAVISVAAIVLVLVAGGAGFIPAYRASRIEPMRALRHE